MPIVKWETRNFPATIMIPLDSILSITQIINSIWHLLQINQNLYFLIKDQWVLPPLYNHTIGPLDIVKIQTAHFYLKYQCKAWNNLNFSQKFKVYNWKNKNKKWTKINFIKDLIQFSNRANVYKNNSYKNLVKNHCLIQIMWLKRIIHTTNRK